jgi:hypothetical protein
LYQSTFQREEGWLASLQRISTRQLERVLNISGDAEDASEHETDKGNKMQSSQSSGQAFVIPNQSAKACDPGKSLHSTTQHYIPLVENHFGLVTGNIPFCGG